MKLVQTDLSTTDCPWHFSNTSMDPSLFRFNNYSTQNLTIFQDCPSGISSPHNLTSSCHNISQRDKHAFYSDEEDDYWQELLKCSVHTKVAVQKGVLEEDDWLNKTLSEGFIVQFIGDWLHCSACSLSGGMCGSEKYNASAFSCHCLNGIGSSQCPEESIIVGTAGALLILICATLCYFKIIFRKTSEGNQEIESFIRDHGPLALTRYKFSEIKKMTKSFKVKLGQGGYGAVYKGELLNGCQVAVKILTASKGNGQDFINEVAGISRTSHINVVTLLGFCLEGQRKALIYEYMPNGSLDKFIHDSIDESSPSLTLEKFYQIAIGIARGLEYLHKGCNTRIVHFDIKPHNILLDEDFCPKISDFGLAKLCPRKQSIISISDARGTIGYLAPEMWNRNFGGVSHKSDVYSYGMMLLDIVGERMNTNGEGSCKSEKYFPDWIYSKLEEGCSLGSNRMMTKEEDDIAKRMTVVGLWCIQTFPMHRPTISRVIEMLEGSLDSLEMPPKPVMSSPTRIEAKSSTATTTITATY